MKLKKSDYQIKENKKRNTSTVLVIGVILILIYFVVYKTFALFSYKETYPIISATVADFTNTDDSCFEIDNDGTITKYNYGAPGCNKDVIIPEQINGIDVKKIATDAFKTTVDRAGIIYGFLSKEDGANKDIYYVYTDLESKRNMYATAYNVKLNQMTEEKINSLSNELIANATLIAVDEDGYSTSGATQGQQFEITQIMGETSDGLTVYITPELLDWQLMMMNAGDNPTSESKYFYSDINEIDAEAMLFQNIISGMYYIKTDMTEDQVVEIYGDALTGLELMSNGALKHDLVVISDPAENSALQYIGVQGTVKKAIKLVELTSNANITDISQQFLDTPEYYAAIGLERITLISLDNLKNVDISDYTDARFYNKYVAFAYPGRYYDIWNRNKDEIIATGYLKGNDLLVDPIDSSYVDKIVFAKKRSYDAEGYEDYEINYLDSSSVVECETGDSVACTIDGESGWAKFPIMFGYDLTNNEMRESSTDGIYYSNYSYPALSVDNLDMSQATKLEVVDDYAFNTLNQYPATEDSVNVDLFDEDDNYNFYGLKSLILPNVESSLEIGYSAFPRIQTDELIVYNNIYNKKVTQSDYDNINNNPESLADLLAILRGPFFASEIGTITIKSHDATDTNQVLGQVTANPSISGLSRGDYMANMGLLVGISAVDTIEIENPISEIGFMEFYGSEAGEIIIPSSVTVLHDNAFEKYTGIITLKDRSISDLNNTITIGNNVFDSGVTIKGTIPE